MLTLSLRALSEQMHSLGDLLSITRTRNGDGHIHARTHTHTTQAPRDFRNSHCVKCRPFAPLRIECEIHKSCDKYNLFISSAHNKINRSKRDWVCKQTDSRCHYRLRLLYTCNSIASICKCESDADGACDAALEMATILTTNESTTRHTNTHTHTDTLH